MNYSLCLVHHSCMHVFVLACESLALNGQHEGKRLDRNLEIRVQIGLEYSLAVLIVWESQQGRQVSALFFPSNAIQLYYRN